MDPRTGTKSSRIIFMKTMGGNRQLNLRSRSRAARLLGLARDGSCQVCRLFLWFAFLFFLFGSRPIASNPQDLRFQLLSVNNIPAYHQTQPLLLEFSHSAS